jgi:hypothetical protein
MKNTIQDLMNHQFAMLETVTDPNIKGELLQEELSRAKAVVEIVGGWWALIASPSMLRRLFMTAQRGMPKIMGIEK